MISRRRFVQQGSSFGCIFVLFLMKVAKAHALSSQGKSLFPGSFSDRSPCKQILSSTYLILPSTRKTLLDLSKIFGIIMIRSLLRKSCLFLGYSFKSRLNSHVPSTAGSVMTIGFSINKCLHSENQFDEREQD